MAGRLIGPRSTVAFLLFVTSPVPTLAALGCKCNSRTCCDARKSSPYHAMNEVWTPSCNWLDLLDKPDHWKAIAVDKPGGYCSDSYNGSFPGERGVCDLIKGEYDISWDETDMPPHLGVYIEPGTCENFAESEDCWSTEANASWFAYWGTRFWMDEGKDCIGSTYPTQNPSVSHSVGLQCHAEQQLRIVMKWLINGSSPNGTSCDVEGDLGTSQFVALDAVLNSTVWFRLHNGPRFHCLNANGEYRVYVVNMGNEPCSIAPTTTPLTPQLTASEGDYQRSTTTPSTASSTASEGEYFQGGTATTSTAPSTASEGDTSAPITTPSTRPFTTPSTASGGDYPAGNNCQGAHTTTPSTTPSKTSTGDNDPDVPTTTPSTASEGVSDQEAPTTTPSTTPSTASEGDSDQEVPTTTPSTASEGVSDQEVPTTTPSSTPSSTSEGDNHQEGEAADHSVRPHAAAASTAVLLWIATLFSA